MMEWKQLLGAQRSSNEAKYNTNPLRSPFETDFDRIIFSHPFRRLQDKTQVHPMPEHDFVHTRLSHSLEVSSVGRSLGKNTGHVIIERHPELKQWFSFHDFGDIVASASLAHDIGNPPFGHSGEQAIGDFFNYHSKADLFQNQMSPMQWQDLTKFEGNAQGFRILTSNKYQGLKLTYATLAAFSKYPRPSIIERDKNKRSQKKFGFFQSESQTFEEIANSLNLNQANNNPNVWSRHPLTFLVEAADDICYGIIDLEDGCRLGLISYAEMEELLAPILGDRFDRKKIERYNSLEEKIGVLRALAISKLIDECTELFLEKETALLNASFDRALTDEISSVNALNDIAAVSLEKIYRAKKVVETETVGFEVLPGILEVITDAVYQRFCDADRLTGRQKSVLRLIPNHYYPENGNEGMNLYQLFLICTDFVSDMTDSAALSFYRKIRGIELPKG